MSEYGIQNGRFVLCPVCESNRILPGLPAGDRSYKIQKLPLPYFHLQAISNYVILHE